MRAQVLGILFLFTAVGLFSAPEDCKVVFQALADVHTVSGQQLNTYAQKLLQKRGQIQEIRPVYTGGFNERRVEQVQIKGVPSQVRLLSQEELSAKVFRHYINGEEYFKEGKELGLLASATTSYVQIYPGLEKRIFEDITGVFLTLPEVSAREVGVELGAQAHYLDVKIPSDVPVVELEKNKIYMIPLPARYHSWVVDAFTKYKRGEEIAPYLLKMCEDIQTRETHRDISEILKVKLNVISAE